MKIKVGTQTFSVMLEDNPTVTKLKSLLPMTLDMTELNGNEKYFHLPSILPTDETKPGTIQSGDIMLYGNKSLVIFYKTFKTSYGYTKLGRIDDPTDLVTVLGKGDVTVTVE